METSPVGGNIFSVISNWPLFPVTLARTIAFIPYHMEFYECSLHGVKRQVHWTAPLRAQESSVVALPWAS